MWIEDHVTALMARERTQEAMRYAEGARAIYRARGKNQPMRVRLGLALVGLGQRIMGQQPPALGGPVAGGASR